jgi:hypothetical protein
VILEDLFQTKFDHCQRDGLVFHFEPSHKLGGIRVNREQPFPALQSLAQHFPGRLCRQTAVWQDDPESFGTLS